MSGSVPPPPPPGPPPPGPPPPGPPPGFPQSQASVLGPGLVGLFVQGIETGLIFAQFSRWFYTRDRKESSILTTIVIFTTGVGLRGFALHLHGLIAPQLCEDWGDYVQSIPTVVISVPVQALMIRQCYYLVGKNMFIITPLVFLLVASVVMSLWSMVIIFHYVAIITSNNPALLQQMSGISWPFLMSIILPSVLDLALTGILIYCLTRTMKQVYAAHTRKRIFRLANIMWQSALLPTVCAICVSALYIRFAIAPTRELQFWLPVLQAMIGKLYVLSLFYMINAPPPRRDGQHATPISTLTIPMDVMNTHTRDARVGDDASCSEAVAEEYGATKTVGFAV
ncbi:hypothetical protein V8E53_005671 [Lactarius tabidus]